MRRRSLASRPRGVIYFARAAALGGGTGQDGLCLGARRAAEHDLRGWRRTHPADRPRRPVRDAVQTPMVDQVAERWQRLLDRLVRYGRRSAGSVWKPSCMAAVSSTRATIAVPSRADTATLADLAASIGHPHLDALIRSVAYRSGSLPEDAPRHSQPSSCTPRRTFGRWQIQPLDIDSSLDAGRSSSPRRGAGSAP